MSTSQNPILKQRSTVLLLIFLVMRIAFSGITILTPEGGLTLDSPSYMDLSAAIRYQQTYHLQGQAEDLVRPPGYPLLLTIFQSSQGLSLEKVILVQLLMTSILSLLILWTFAKIGYPSAGLVAGWLIAISPNIVLWSLTIMSESLFTFLLVVSFVLLIGYLFTGSRSQLFLAGLAIGMATLTRPIGLMVFILWIILLVITQWRLQPEKKSWATFGIFLIGGCIFILPWMFRNAVEHQQFTVSNVGEHTIVSFNFAVIVSEAEGISRSDAATELNKRGGLSEQFLYVVQEYPEEFIEGQIAGIRRVVIGEEMSRWARVTGQENWDGLGIFRYLRLLDVTQAFESLRNNFRSVPNILMFFVYLIGIFHTLVLMALGIIGLRLNWTTDPLRSTLVLISALTAATLILSTGAAGQARFRVPAEPFIAVLAGFGWLNLKSWWEGRKTPERIEEPE